MIMEIFVVGCTATIISHDFYVYTIYQRFLTWGLHTSLGLCG